LGYRSTTRGAFVAANAHRTRPTRSLIAGVDHIAILVRDIDASLPYYVSTLGLPLVHDERLSDPPVRLAYLDCGNVFIQLVEPLGNGVAATLLEVQGEGFYHVCYAVADIERVLASTEPGIVSSIFLGGRGRRACFLAGTPNRVVVELTEIDPVADRTAAAAYDA
jgi:methylmalonyl-CoA/ethylmalonyl-CoA epimerase